MQRYMSMNLRKNSSEEPSSGAINSQKLPFQFQLETEKGFPHEGVLDFVDNQVDQQTGTISVRGTIPNPQGLFVPGSRVKIRVPIGASRSVMLVPDTAVLSDQGQTLRPRLSMTKTSSSGTTSPPEKLLDDGMRIVLPNADGKNFLS